MNLDDMTSTELHKWVLNRPVVKEAAAFLDEMADHMLKLVVYPGDWFDKSAADCRGLAAKLRGTS